MRIRSKVLGLASLLVVSIISGCDDGGSKKSSSAGATHIINQVGIRVTATQDTGSHSVPNDGVDGAGAAITINVEGDDFEDFNAAANLVVALAEVSSGDFNTTVAGVTTGTAAFPFAILPVTHTLVDQGLITFAMPAISPLTAITGDVRVVVLMRGVPNDVDTTVGATPGVNRDVLTLTSTAQGLNNGLTASLAVTGPGAGAFGAGYPGSSGLVMASTITNNTGETVSVDDITTGNRNVAFGAAVHNFLIDDVFPFNLLNGASRTVRYVAAITEDGIRTAMTGQVVYSTTGQGQATNGQVSNIARVVSASATFTSLTTPTFSCIGGSTRTRVGAATSDAGGGGTVTLTADGSVNIGTLTTVAAPATIVFAGAVFGDILLTDNVGVGANDLAPGAPWELNGTLNVAGVPTAGRTTITLQNTNAGAGDDVIEIFVPGNILWRAVDVIIDNTAADSGQDITRLSIRAGGSIQMEDVNFRLQGLDQYLSAATPEKDGINLELRADANDLLDATAGDTNSAAASFISLNNVTINTYGGTANTGAFIAGSGGSITLSGPTGGGDTPGCPGDVTLFNVDVDATGGDSNVGGQDGGVGGTFGVAIGEDVLAIDDGDIRINSTSSFNLTGGGNISNALGAGVANTGGSFNLGGLAGANLSVNDNEDDGMDIVFNGTVICDGGDYDGAAGGNAGLSGSVGIAAGGDISIGATGGSVTIITNGGSASIPGGFSGTGDGGDAGDIIITTGQDGNQTTAGQGNGDAAAQLNDGEFLLQGTSTLVANGGACTGDGANDAGDGGNISVTNNTSQGTDQLAVNVINVIAGNMVASGGFVRGEIGTSAGATIACGDAGSITISMDADITVSGNLVARGGSIALDGALDATTLNLRVDGGDGAGSAAGSDVGIAVDTGADFQGNIALAAAIPVLADSAYHGDLVVSGNIVSQGGGVIDGVVGGDVAGDGGRVLLVCDGDGTVATNVSACLISGTVVANGGPVFLGDLAGNTSTEGGGGDLTVDGDLSGTLAVHDSDIEVTSSGVLRADGGWYEVNVNETETTAYGAATAAGGVDIVMLDNAAAVSGNNGDCLIAGTLTARGDGIGGGFGVFVQVSQQPGVVPLGDDNSTTNLTISGTIEVGETDMGAAVQASVVLSTDAGDLDVTGSVLGNRSIIQIDHFDSTGTQTLVSGTIENDHRSTLGNDGSIAINSGAEETAAATLNEDILITGTLRCNAGTITVAHSDPAVVNNDGRVELRAATINADMVDNPVFAVQAAGNFVGGDITIGGLRTDEVDYVSGTVSANGGETLVFLPAATPLPLPAPASNGTGGAGGTVSMGANDLLDVLSSITANGADQTNGAGGAGIGGTVNLGTSGVLTGGGNAANADVNITGPSITATGGNRSNGGVVNLAVDGAGTGTGVAGAILTVTTTITVDAGANTYLDPSGLAIDFVPFLQTSINLSALDVAGGGRDLIVATSAVFNANGGDNDAGAAGYGGSITFQSANNLIAGGEVTVTGCTLNANGGNSTSNLGGLGGNVNFTDLGAPVFLSDLLMTTTSMSVNGGTGGSTGGDAGTIYFDNDATLNAQFDFTGAAAGGNSANLAGGTGAASGSAGLFVLDVKDTSRTSSDALRVCSAFRLTILLASDLQERFSAHDVAALPASQSSCFPMFFSIRRISFASARDLS